MPENFLYQQISYIFPILTILFSGKIDSTGRETNDRNTAELLKTNAQNRTVCSGERAAVALVDITLEDENDSPPHFKEEQFYAGQ